MIQTMLNLISVIFVTLLHIFINFKISPLITNLFLKFIVQLSSSVLVIVVYNKVFKFN